MPDKEWPPVLSRNLCSGHSIDLTMSLRSHRRLRSLGRTLNGFLKAVSKKLDFIWHSKYHAETLSNNRCPDPLPLCLAGCSSPAPTRLASAKPSLLENPGSGTSQSLHLAAVKPASDGNAESVARVAQATPHAQEPSGTTKIRVGTKRFEPFVFSDEDGELSGFSVDLWNAIAAELGVEYEWVPADTVNQLIEDVRSGKPTRPLQGSP